MSDLLRGQSPGTGLPAYMDLLSHDILNLNQTVLSYIELMSTSSDLDERLLEHAKKATSQIRISTQIVESINKLCLLQKEDVVETATDLSDRVADAARALESLLPHRNITCHVRFPDSVSRATVLDVRNLVSQAVLNALMNIVQLDTSEAPEIELSIERLPENEGGNWLVKIHDDRISMHPDTDLEALMDGDDDSRSRTVRLAGVLLSKLMIERLGGTFEMVCPRAGGGTVGMTFTGAEPR